MNKKQTKKEDKFSKILNKILKKLEKLNNIEKKQGNLEKKQDKFEKVQNEHSKTLDEHGEMLGFLLKKYSNHEDGLIRIEENMFTKEDGQKILNAIDSFSGDVSRLDQENIVGSRIIKRINDDMREQKEITDRHEKEIQKLKAKAAV